MTELLTIRKAAILVAALDSSSAEAVLDQLPIEDAQRVRHAAHTLGPFSNGERQAVLREFWSRRQTAGKKATPEQSAGQANASPPKVPIPGSLRPESNVAGIELDGEFARRLVSPGTDTSTESSPSPLGSLLQQADWESLAPLLEREHPQTLAVIAAHLPHSQAARLLASLSPNLQVEVIRRLTDLAETDPAIWAEIETQLAAWMDRQQQTRARRQTGIGAVAGILKAADAERQRLLITNLRRHDQRLADRLVPTGEPRPTSEQLTFADLLQLDDRPLAAIVSQVAPNVLVQALQNAKTEVVDRVAKLLAPATAQSMRDNLATREPVPARDVKRAQNEILLLARRLEQQLKMNLERRRLSVAV